MADWNREKSRKMAAANFFMARANEAIGAAERARTDEATAAFYKEAESWLYMASQCLNPESGAEPPEPLRTPTMKVGRERRSFGRED